jgi:hypothetical protein
MDVLGRPITDPYQAFSDLLLFLLPSAPMPAFDIGPAISYLAAPDRHIVTFSFMRDLKLHMAKLRWGFFDQTVFQEIAAQVV